MPFVCSFINWYDDGASAFNQKTYACHRNDRIEFGGINITGASKKQDWLERWFRIFWQVNIGLNTLFIITCIKCDLLHLPGISIRKCFNSWVQWIFIISKLPKEYRVCFIINRLFFLVI